MLPIVLKKIFFKFLNNSDFGKTMEKSEIAKPNLLRFKIFNEDLAAAHIRKTTLRMNRPIDVKDAQSKTLMYDFHYNYIQQMYEDSYKLLFTDSLCYEIQTEDIYKNMQQDFNLFNFSD